MCTNIAVKASLARPIILHDISQGRLEAVHSEIGVARSMMAKSISEAVALADVVFYSVPDDTADFAVVCEILRTPGGVRGKVIVDCTTVSPNTTNEASRLIADGGASFVACPVFGTSKMADAGQLTCVLSGPSSATESVKPFCQFMARAMIDLSDEEPGQATRLKVVGNTLVYNLVSALSEGHVLAEKSGLQSENLHKWVEIFLPGLYAAYSTRMLSGDYCKYNPPLASVDIGRKDIRHAQKLALEAGMVMKNLELADEYLRMVQEFKGSEGEVAAMYGAKRVEAGLSFEV